MEVQVNYLAVLFAAISSMVVGSVWYAKPVFGTVWMKLVKLDEKKMNEGAGVAMTGAFVLALLMAYIIAHVTFISQYFFGVTFMNSALQTAFWLWLGIALPTVAVHGLFEHRRKKLMALTVAHQLVTMVVMGLIIGAMGV